MFFPFADFDFVAMMPMLLELKSGMVLLETLNLMGLSSFDQFMTQFVAAKLT